MLLMFFQRKEEGNVMRELLGRRFHRWNIPVMAEARMLFV